MAALAIASFCSCESESLDTLNKESGEFTEIPMMITKSDSEMIDTRPSFEILPAETQMCFYETGGRDSMCDSRADSRAEITFAQKPP